MTAGNKSAPAHIGLVFIGCSELRLAAGFYVAYLSDISLNMFLSYANIHNLQL
jgi:hypothetical protein